MYKSCLFKRFSTIFTALFYPYIAHERTSQNLILLVRSSLFALFLIERHRSRNHGLLKSEERLSDCKERCAQLCYLQTYVHVYNAVLYSICSALVCRYVQYSVHAGPIFTNIQYTYVQCTYIHAAALEYSCMHSNI